MSIESLKQQIDAEYDLWIEKGDSVLTDGKVTCADAKEWLAWYKARKRQLLLLKKELNLHLRGIRSEYRLKASQAPTRAMKKQLRQQRVQLIEPYEHLKQRVERLLLEGEKLYLTMEKQIEELCA